MVKWMGALKHAKEGYALGWMIETMMEVFWFFAIPFMILVIIQVFLPHTALEITVMLLMLALILIAIFAYMVISQRKYNRIFNKTNPTLERWS